MFSLLKMECRTGNAEKFKCRQCGAEFWVQLTHGGGLNFRPLRETSARIVRELPSHPDRMQSGSVAVAA